MEKNSIYILIVEDNPADARLIVEMLKECSGPSFKPSHADRIDKALKMLENKEFDVVLLDLNLPDSKGLDGLERITAQNPQISVILLTGNDDENTGIQALQKNAGDYLIKGEINEYLLCRSIRYAIERKHSEVALRQSQETFSELVERAPFGIYIINSDFRITHMNAGSQNGAFRNVRPVIGRDFNEAMRILWPEPVAAEIIANFRRTLETGKPYYSPRFTNLRHDVEIVESYEWELHRMTLPDGQYGVICYYFDSTKLRDTERSLRESEARLKLAQVSAGAGVWDWDMVTGKLQWSEELFRLLGLDPEKTNSDFESWRSVIHPDDRQEAEKLINTAIKQRIPLVSGYRIVRASGEVRWINALGNTTYDKSGKPQRMSGICIDITENKRSEESTRAALNRFYLALSSLTFGALLIGEDGRIEFANQVFCDIFDLKESPEELKALTSGQIIEKIKHAYLNPEEAVAHILKIVAKGNPVKDEDVPMSGKRTFLRDFIPLRFGENKQGRLWIHKDITERKRVEEDLQKTNNILKALSDSSEELIRASTVSDYLEHICWILVKDCEYKMAWMGFAEIDKDKTVRPVAQAGFEKGYLKTVDISWADTERGRGPTGTCIRTGKPVICRDILNDPHFTPWRAEALKRGYASSIALPLLLDGKSFGAVTLYSVHQDPFTDEEVKLLSQLVDDISYGITVLRLRKAREKAEEEAKSAHLKTKFILESITEAYIVFDHQGRFVELNKTAEGFLGKKAEEIRGKVVWKVFPKAREVAFYRQFRKALARNKEVHFEAYSSIAHKWFEVHAYPSEGELTVYLHDISSRKAAEDTLNETSDYLNNLINCANAPIIVWDPDFTIVRFNQAFEFISGYGYAEVVGKELTLLFPEENRTESLAKIERTLKGEHWDSVEIPILCKDGSVKLLLWNSANIYKRNKSLLATIAQGQDITLRKKAEVALLKSRLELEDRVTQRTADLLKAQKELMAAKRLSDIGALSATVAHELRNPLGVIRAAAFNVRRKNQSPDLEKHLDRIDKKILESDQIINNLLFYSRIKSPHFESVRLPDILKEVVTDAKIKNKDSRVIIRNNFRALKNILIEGDPAQLYELFSNILNNAYEAFSGNKGMIEIKGVFDGGNGVAKVSFKDNGCGIEEEILQKIHDPFFTTKSQGTGLGLAVCSQVARLHSGKIEVTSCMGKGSVFTVILPAKPAPEKEE